MNAPDAAAVRRTAEALRIPIEHHEIEHVRRLLAALLPAAVAYDSIPDPQAPLSGESSDRTYWPSGDDDPWNALIHGCRVQTTTAGPLAGVRIAVKDCIMVRGLPLTAGTRFLSGYTADRDATVVGRLLDAGAVVIGTANMEPFACGVGMAGVRDYGVVDNPIAPGFSAGGSSSGSAAAVAGGLADAAVGTDTHGSVRLPAAWCGLVGLKPTHGRVPHTGVLGHEFYHDHVGPIAADVATLTAVLAVVSGRDSEDARYEPVRPRPEWRIQRIGVLAEGVSATGDPQVREAFELMVDELQRSGYSVSRVSVPEHVKLPAVQMPFFYAAMGTWWQSGLLGQPQDGCVPQSLADAINKAIRTSAADLPLFVRSLAAAGGYLQNEYGQHFAAHARAFRRQARRAYDALWDEIDALVMPTIPLQSRRYERGATPERDAALAATGGSVTLGELSALTMNTSPFNFTGHPALTVPIARNGAGGIGLQLVGPLGSDEQLLELGFHVEQLRPAPASPPPSPVPGRTPSR